jgi:hypothetical protein
MYVPLTLQSPKMYHLLTDKQTLKLVSISFEVQPDQDRQTLYRDAIF